MDVSSYDLFIDLDFQGLKFNGTLRVKLKTDQDVVLNAVALDITRIFDAKYIKKIIDVSGQKLLNVSQYLSGKR